jgi:hypothetical protein
LGQKGHQGKNVAPCIAYLDFRQLLDFSKSWHGGSSLGPEQYSNMLQSASLLLDPYLGHFSFGDL